MFFSRLFRRRPFISRLVRLVRLVRRAQPLLEWLEDRSVPAVVITPTGGTLEGYLYTQVASNTPSSSQTEPLLAATALAPPTAQMQLDSLTFGGTYNDVIFGITAYSVTLSGSAVMNASSVASEANGQFSTAFNFPFSISGTSTTSDNTGTATVPLSATAELLGQNLTFQIQADPADGLLPGQAVTVTYDADSGLTSQPSPATLAIVEYAERQHRGDPELRRPKQYRYLPDNGGEQLRDDVGGRVDGLRCTNSGRRVVQPVRQRPVVRPDGDAG